MKIYHNPRCTKSRETLQILESENADFEVVKYLDTPLDKKELKHIIDLLGISPEQLIRKSEAVYKDQYKGKEMTDEECIVAMIEHPSLMQRPIVVSGDRAVIGRPPELVLDLLQ